MDDYNTDSPLSTRAKRDKFVRPPLSVLGAETPRHPPRTKKKEVVTNEPEEKITPNRSTSLQSGISPVGKEVTDNKRTTRRSPRNRILTTTSPPSLDYCTSSPITGSGNHFTSPQVSMIDKKTPEVESHSSRKNVSRGSGSMVKKTLVCEEDGSSSESDEGKTRQTPSISSKSLLSKSKSRRDNQSVTQTATLTPKVSKTNKSKRDLDHESSPFCAATSIVLSTVVFLLISMFIVAQLKPDLLDHIMKEIPETRICGKGEAFKRFSHDMEKMKMKYPRQNPKSWSKLSGSIRRNMNGKAQQPLCFLFVYNETAKITSNCLVKAVGTSIFFAINDGIVDHGGVFNIKSADFKTKDQSEAKGELFSNIDSSLKKDNVVILEDISQLGSNPVMALHGICEEAYLTDQEVKPVVLMTISDTELIEDGREATNEFEYGAKLIRSLWEKDLGSDKVHPLISRIASVVIQILPENQMKECPHL